MHQPDVAHALTSVGQLLDAHTREVERLKEAFAYRMERLAEERRREELNPLLRERVERAVKSVSRARSVHDAYSRMLTALLRFSRSAVASTVSSRTPQETPATVTIREFAQLYSLLGYASVAETQVLVTVNLREIFETGKFAAETPRLKAVMRVGGEVAADEALKYSGADSAQNVAKVIKVIADARAAMNVSVKSVEDVSRWLDQLDAADASLEDWMRIVQGDLERIEHNVRQFINAPAANA